MKNGTVCLIMLLYVNTDLDKIIHENANIIVPAPSTIEKNIVSMMDKMNNNIVILFDILFIKYIE